MWLSTSPCTFIVIWSAANDSPGTSEGSAGSRFMCRAPGSGLSGPLLASGAARVTVRPSRTSPAAAISRAAVMWFSAPRRSPGPHCAWARICS
jgi:hypothetical protein